MRSQTPLTLIEQTVMLLVFALAAVLCLQVFVWSQNASVESRTVDHASLEAQNAAELLKNCRGDYEKAAELGGWTSVSDGWTIGYDEDWQETEQSPAYTVTVTAGESTQPLLGAAEITVSEVQGEPLFSLPVCWQEVSAHG